MRRLLLFPLLLLLVAAAAAWPSAAPRRDAHPLGPGESTRRALFAALDTASPVTLFRMASLLETGWRDLEPDSLLADSLRRLSAAEGYPPAVNRIGHLLYSQGDTAAGLAMIRRAAEAGDARALYNLGVLLQKEGSDSAALPYHRRAAAEGLGPALMALGDYYRAGRHVARDLHAADSLYDRAVLAGFSPAQSALAALYEQELGIPPAASCLVLGLRYYTGGAPALGVWFFGCAADSVAQAEALLGDAFSRGYGVPYDYLESLCRFYNAACRGYAPAQFVIAEQLDFFPDALQQIPDSLLTCACGRISDPEYWRALARQAGITDARQAADSMFSTPNHFNTDTIRNIQ